MKAGQRKLTDQEVISLLRERSAREEGIKFLYQNHFESLGWFVVKNNGSWEDAQDNFQEVLVSFIHLVDEGKFRGDSSIKTFLFSMNRNIWFNELKRRERSEVRNKIFDHAQDQAEPTIEHILVQREARGRLMRIMDDLGENCKKILLLFYYENYSIREILSELDYENEQVVRNKKSKCLKRLEELIRSQKDLVHHLKHLLRG